jgi:hypothetical protein
MCQVAVRKSKILFFCSTAKKKCSKVFYIVHFLKSDLCRYIVEEMNREEDLIEEIDEQVKGDDHLNESIIDNSIVSTNTDGSLPDIDDDSKNKIYIKEASLFERTNFVLSSVFCQTRFDMTEVLKKFDIVNVCEILLR